MIRALVAAMALGVVAGCAGQPAAPEAARKDLAPTGKLRGGMNLSNALFTGKDPATGELRGVSVDLMRELAVRLGVPVEFVVYPTPGEVADDAGANKWDVAVLAIEQSRAKTIAFSPPMTEIEATYVVHRNSRLRTAAQVDAPGVRIAAANKAGYELYLTRTIRHATIVRPNGFGAAMDVFNQNGADALAALKPALLDSMAKLPDARMVEGNFMTVNHGLGTPRERAAGAAYLEVFVKEMIASGFIARSIERNGVKGLTAIR
jgi:polar amino acid transport system substrate-binding protein